MTVDGAGTSLSAAGYMEIGVGGTGTLTVAEWRAGEHAQFACRCRSAWWHERVRQRHRRRLCTLGWQHHAHRLQRQRRCHRGRGRHDHEQRANAARLGKVGHGRVHAGARRHAQYWRRGWHCQG
ncbi:MAG: hypothetical protein IPK97_14520 [Ahniella sp.]|nr:hypothetical protein [Ahniella sp.]